MSNSLINRQLYANVVTELCIQWVIKYKEKGLDHPMIALTLSKALIQLFLSKNHNGRYSRTLLKSVQTCMEKIPEKLLLLFFRNYNVVIQVIIITIT